MENKEISDLISKKLRLRSFSRGSEIPELS